MKALNRDFSKKSKILILILVIILLALCYYRFVYIPIGDSIAQAQNDKSALEDEQMIVTVKCENAKKMSAEVEELKKKGNVSTMPSYNGSKQEVAFLNSVLAPALDYDVTFTTISRNGDQIRRNFTLSFSAASYADAERIIKDLYNSNIRLLIGDISMKTLTSRNAESRMQVSLTATFYETMVDGVADGGLPADSSNN